ncbi:hypothetical protein GPECTOR_9g541 [Gonium pectorale]|uniref:Uncharacterized protein n=1 Tax=Gonium pectorale TaxID=33097 RepID=A0A150GRQ4_GONPE|nr:hypothetical protein GPECTOR_9g541 [Gonium pectorale]|eukprot:KXZ52497.1 hypothetical protein GPECTOR_9g541 [Gonium pectorale]
MRAESEAPGCDKLEAVDQGPKRQHKLHAELQQEIESLKEQLASSTEAGNRKHLELAAGLKKAQDYIGQLISERKHVDAKFYEMKADLITRLQNACAQRDEARGNVMTLEADLAKLHESLEAKDRELAAARAMAGMIGAMYVTAASSPATQQAIGTPAPAASAVDGDIEDMLQQLQNRHSPIKG